MNEYIQEYTFSIKIRFRESGKYHLPFSSKIIYNCCHERYDAEKRNPKESPNLDLINGSLIKQLPGKVLSVLLEDCPNNNDC